MTMAKYSKNELKNMADYVINSKDKQRVDYLVFCLSAIFGMSAEQVKSKIKALANG